MGQSEPEKENKTLLKEFYNTLLAEFGPQAWWPARTRFEVIVGAILTQNTAWTNVEKAIKNLKKAGLLSPAKLYESDIQILAGLIRPAGYFNIKARRLKNFLDFLYDNYNGRLQKFLSVECVQLRHELLAINGIGPETADSILLYAAGKPAFVVDAYTKRILERHGLVTKEATYHEIQALFLTALKPEAKKFNEYHALIVRVGKEFCKTRNPRCAECPLGRFLSKST